MHVLTVFSDYNTSSIINLVVPLRHLEGQGKITLEALAENEVTPQHVRDADILVVGRAVDPTFKPIYELARQLHIPIIYDLDDNLFEVPKSSVLYAYYQNPTKRAHLDWMLRQAYCVRVHSPVLEEVIAAYNSNIHRVWGAIDWSLVPPSLPTLRTDPLEIVYAASTFTGEMFFSIIRDDLEKLLAHYPDKIRLHCLGYNPPEFKGHSQVVFEPFESDYAAFFSQFTRHGYAIGLAPMLDGNFYQSKTNLKYRDYAAAGAVGVYSDCPLYRDGVIQGETGILAPNSPGSWFAALSGLIENPTLLETIRDNARKAVQQRYNIEVVAQMWMDDLSAAPIRPTPSAEQAQFVQQQTWWFNRPRKPASKTAASIRQLYLAHVPFRLHVVLSKLYHRFKRLAALLKF